MSSGEGRARGRARARARAAPMPTGDQPTRRPGESAPPGGGGRSTTPRSYQPPAEQQQQQYQQPQRPPMQQQQQQAPPPQQRMGRYAARPREEGGGDAGGLPERMQGLNIGGGDGAPSGGTSVGRGALRGRREIPQAIWTRPSTITSKKGEYGDSVRLTANYFKLLTHTDWALYQYRVDFDPEQERTVTRKWLLKAHKETLGGYIFDGTVLFTSHRLHPEPMEVFSSFDSGEKVRIIIKKAAELVMGDHHYIQFFNILMRKCLDHLKMQLVGRNYFDPKALTSIPQYRLELWPGYVTSIRQHEESILMCAEITSKVMRQDTVLDLMEECAKKSSGDWKDVFTQAIVGAVVLTGYNNSTYRVDDVDFDSRPDSTFLYRNEKISFIKYYEMKYKIKIRQPGQPLLVSRAKARNIRAGMPDNIMLVPELCRLTGLTDDMRADFNMMKALGEHTRVGPSARIDKLKQFNQRLYNTPAIQEDLTQWNMQLSRELVEFPGRIMFPEKILHGKGKKSDGNQEADFTRNLRSAPMLVMGNLENWAVIYPSHLGRDTKSFVQTLAKSASSLHFNIPQPEWKEIQNDRAGSYVEALDRLISTSNPQLIMCIVTRNRADTYAAIKKKSCVDRAVPTQVVVSRNLTSKGVMSIATKIAIQMNCKIGGAPWSVEIPIKGLMVVGYDVCHDTSYKGRSFGAMVASLDQALSRYYSTVSHHSTGEELSNDFSANILKALKKYKDYNQGQLPARILIYRDGVGEGQIPFVFQHEVELIRSKLSQLYGDALKLSFVVVTKRLNTRLFLNGNNPPPGTVADDVITCPDRYDFFLVSQSVRQGTVSPTSYNVIHDTSGLPPDRMQRLTYKMTHLYYNWSGTVRVPAQCQYAHKLAFLVGQSLHRAPNVGLEDLLYFL